jgi:hypothetical protein
MCKHSNRSDIDVIHIPKRSPDLVRRGVCGRDGCRACVVDQGIQLPESLRNKVHGSEDGGVGCDVQLDWHDVDVGWEREGLEMVQRWFGVVKVPAAEEEGGVYVTVVVTGGSGGAARIECKVLDDREADAPVAAGYQDDAR